MGQAELQGQRLDADGIEVDPHRRDVAVMTDPADTARPEGRMNDRRADPQPVRWLDAQIGIPLRHTSSLPGQVVDLSQPRPRRVDGARRLDVADGSGPDADDPGRGFCGLVGGCEGVDFGAADAGWEEAAGEVSDAAGVEA